MPAVRSSIFPNSALLSSDFESFRRQEVTFTGLSLFVLSLLLLIHIVFAAHYGNPSPRLIAVFAAGFLLQALELIWLAMRTSSVGRGTLLLLTAFSITVNTSVSLALVTLSRRPDSPYFVLMVVPILIAALRFPLPAAIGVAAAAGACTFFALWYFARCGGEVPITEYFEAGSISLIFLVSATLVWLLVEHLRGKQRELENNLAELERTRGRLLIEEKLAAVGRLSSAIAHEIRNPVAMISSSLAMARGIHLPVSEREEMFGIAAAEASRLEALTNDFLAYARPSSPRRAAASLRDTVEYVAGVCLAKARERGIAIRVTYPEDMVGNVDASQIQRALLNLVMNAVEASPENGVVHVGLVSEEGFARVDVDSDSGPIPGDTAARMFEPFFTTKAGGTGLGLAIARNIARAHDGDLVLAENSPCVRFRFTVPAGQVELAATNKV